MNPIFTVDVTDEMDEGAEKFADAFLYDFTKRQQEKNPSTEESRWRNCYIGKLAEYGAREFLLTMHDDVPPVDLEFRTKEERKKIKYDTDFYVPSVDTHYHVKAQRMVYATRYGISWLVAKWDPIINLPEPEDKGVFCVVDLSVDPTQIHIMGVWDMNRIVGLKRVPDESFAEWGYKLHYNDIIEHVR